MPRKVFLFCFWDDKDKIYYLLFQIKNEIFFPAFFLPFFPLFSKPESYLILPFNQLFALKRVQMYETFFIIQIIVQVFLALFCISPPFNRYIIVFKILKKQQDSDLFVKIFCQVIYYIIYGKN